MSAPLPPPGVTGSPSQTTSSVSDAATAAVIRLAKLQRWFNQLQRITVAVLPGKRAAAPATTTDPAYYRELVETIALPPYPALPLDPRFERMGPRESADVARTARLAAAAVIDGYCSAKQEDPAAKATRDQHAKHHGCVQARFLVREDLPRQYAHGVFEPGARYDAVLRFSNAMGKPGSDRKPDGRGMAIKLRGIGGASLLSLVPGGADLPGVRVGEQDFLLTNYPVFFGKNVADYSRFMNILKPTRSRWQGVLKLGQLFTFIVLGGRWHQLGIFVRQALRRTDSPLHESYFSMTPYLMGEDTVVRYVATPSPGSVGVGANALAPSRSPSFLREAMVAELESEGGRDGDHSFAAAFDFAAQVRHTPAPEDVEDASRAWADIRDVTVPLARIEIPWQVFTGAECQFDCENLSFNPWHSLPQHRPLGGLNRMRLAVYLASAQLRHRLNMLDAI